MGDGDPGGVSYPFCCAVNGGPYDMVEITGSANHADTLRFSDASGAYNMDRYTTGATILTGQINGNGNSDILIGSNIDTNFSETLNGDAGDDILNGRGGLDYLNGGAGSDTIIAGAGDDVCDGGTEHDEIQGGEGMDTIYGGGAGDFISGGNGDDTIDGGSGGDVICGDAHTNGDWLEDGDSVDDGAFDDKLWGGENANDEVTCGHNSTQVDANSTPWGSCSGTPLPSAPAECP